MEFTKEFLRLAIEVLSSWYGIFIGAFLLGFIAGEAVRIRAIIKSCRKKGYYETDRYFLNIKYK